MKPLVGWCLVRIAHGISVLAEKMILLGARWEGYCDEDG
jgi:hypothetical protein